MSIYLYLSLYLYVCLYLSLYLYICLYLYLYLYVCLSIYLSVLKFICLPVCICLSLCYLSFCSLSMYTCSGVTRVYTLDWISEKVRLFSFHSLSSAERRHLKISILLGKVKPRRARRQIYFILLWHNHLQLTNFIKLLLYHK